MQAGMNFQRLTKYDRRTLQGKRVNWDRKPDPYKTYPQSLERVRLTSPDRGGGEPLFKLLNQRRSVRRFKAIPLELHMLSQLLWASQGLSHDLQHQPGRTAPSAGALYPIESYVVVNQVYGLKAGVYHYQVPEHMLVLIREGDFGQALAEAALGQTMIQNASCTFVWSAIAARSAWKYGERAFRYIYMDAGHIAQNLQLAAESCGLGLCPVAAFFDDEVNGILQLDGDHETVIYLAPLGKR